MFTLNANARVWILVGTTDMRKAVNGLSSLVAGTLSLDPYSGQYFVFSGRQRDTIKVLYWDKNGYCLWYKRLEQDRFRWPRSSEEAKAITSQELEWLLAGLDYERAHRPRKFST